MQAWLDKDKRRILRWSITRQLSVLALMLLTSLLVPPFDDSGRLLLERGSRSRLLARTALPFTQWDTLHFLGIAKDGYATEQQFAFMPGVPLLLRFFGHRLGTSHRFDAAEAVLGVSLVANCISVCLPLVLYSLTIALFGLQHRRAALTASLLYCLYPAPSVLAVPYTEPFYALFTFTGMLAIARSQVLLATVTFVLAAAFRSNGLLNAGFLLWHLFWVKPSPSMILILVRALVAASSIVVIGLPFAMQQTFAYRLLCQTGNPRPWCESKMPLVYTFAQEHYWNVGFLRYFRPEQIPNFVLAAPILGLSFAASWRYYRSTWPAWLRHTLLPGHQAALDSRPFFFSASALPHIHLHTILTLQLCLFGHVQIALRQALTNPVVFWVLAYLRGQSRKGAAGRRLLLATVIFVPLWTAFYPPA